MTYPVKSSALAAALLVACSLSPALANDELELDGIHVLFSRGEHREALAQLDAYLERNPEDALAWTYLGDLRNRLDLQAEAAKAYEQALELDPDRVDALTGKGVLARKSGDLEEAMGLYRRAVEIDPGYAQAYSSMLVIAIQQKKYGSAVANGEKAHELDPKDPAIAANLAVAYHYADQPEKRDKMLQKADALGYPKMDRLRELVSQ